MDLIRLVVLDLPRWRAQRADPLSWQLTHFAPGVLIALFATIGAPGMLTTSVGGLYWIAAAMGIATAAGLINSWVLLVEIKR